MSLLSRALEELHHDDVFMQQVSRWITIPAKSGVYENLPENLDQRIIRALQDRGINELYSHQRKSYDLVNQGRSVCIVTPTASGKTLSYNLPVIQGILTQPESRALYLFPTKALSQDQQAGLNEIALTGVPVKIATYDGDTPTSLRASARQTGQIIISNPDMLHSGILPNHPKWIKFLKNLKYVVIDELHAYRGIFGSHLSNLIRRLRRILDFYGVDPVFICCSATIGNPGELAQQITGRECILIDENGAPAGEKHVVLYNPPLVDRVQGIRRSSVKEAQEIMSRFLRRGIKTITFARSRVRVELIASYVRQSLANHFTQNRDIRVESYRGGYLPQERREIEAGLRNGSVQGVVSTNALELGIDIGGLDAAVLAGFPGSIASVWQQAGRAGRSNESSVAVIIASASPLDQYMVEHPEYFEGRAPEYGFINPENPFILTDHIRCAAFELPFTSTEDWFPDAQTYLEYLTEEGMLRHTQGRYYWADRGYPAESISLRSATNENIVIIDTTHGKNQVIGEMDRPSAKELIFPRAVYLHRGTQYTVQELDLEQRRCYIQESTLNYYTDAVVKRDIKVLQEDQLFNYPTFRASLGDILVRSQVSKFKKLKFNTHENIGYGEVQLPEEEMHTRALAILLSPESTAGAVITGMDQQEATSVLSRVGHIIKQVAPALLLCDTADIGVSERLKDPHFQIPVIYVYDQYPGGSGLSESFAVHAQAVLQASLDLVSGCGCKEGCPSCLGPRNAEEEILENPKPWTIKLLKTMMEVV
ncbi:DEAD/DEAH box helicase [Spirochaeta lutea]|uniref:ATP-dependent helicase n=1 Tax=Spirochaeta lutea TaxID=1480694 RepID=A0A098R0Q5_9SPIO|nr:DEAD/DEAH box helicase [Spirochaeta lutea]KGE73559.1 ATP-dependent helicase [Spirochaeta lutea]